MSTISFKESPGYKGGQVLKLNAALIVCTTVIVFLRLYVRAFMSRALGVDDLLAFLAYVRYHVRFKHTTCSQCHRDALWFSPLWKFGVSCYTRHLRWDR